MGRQMRLDQYVSTYVELTRKEAKEAIRSGDVCVNGAVVKQANSKIDVEAIVTYRGDKVEAEEFVYYMLNKPAGVVSATRDEREQTVLSLLPETKRELFPMGRLDKDTLGLLILTDDGLLAHRLLSPAHHVAKMYDVIYAGNLPEQAVSLVTEGLEIGERKRTLPAKLEILEPGHARLTISEGKFHQVKRMFAALGAKVVKLTRISFAGVVLDSALQPGEYRKLTEKEINQLKKGE